MTMTGKVAITMASYSPFNKHLYPGGPPSESLSELSSADSSDWSDLRTIAVQLGVSNPDELASERFKIDRQKLEIMVNTETNLEGMNKAEDFFDKIMKETTTVVNWPSRLKIGAKTKKDPHVRIVGRQENVLKAKERIMASLDSRGTRVIMKMDVSYTDHSCIIGRGGNNIKHIMEATSTHIHFPDSNRSNPTEKSNQVSLCGTLEGVEKARSLVRASTPLLISFELPIMAPGHPVPDNETGYVKEVEDKYNVMVIFSTRPKLHSSLVLVKGQEKEVLHVKQATQILINQMCENIAHQIPVSMQMDISTHHHPAVLGVGSCNLRDIMNRTGTKIMFPDACDVNIKPIKRSQVSITGSIDGVYIARQQLIGNLPVTLIFDYPENSVESDQINSMMKNLDLFIQIKNKSKQSTLCVVIKGIEKNINKMYEARHRLLQLQTPVMKAEIPSTYFSDQDDKFPVASLLSIPPLTPTSPLTPTLDMPFPGVSPWYKPVQDFKLTSLRNQLHNLNISPCPSPNNTRLHPLTNRYNYNHNNITMRHLTPPAISPRNNLGNASSMNNTNVSSTSSGYGSFSSRDTSMEQSFHQQHNAKNQTNEDNSKGFPDQKLETKSSEGNRKKSIDSLVFEFDQKKLLGHRAMENQACGELRVPTPVWYGMGLSKTSPLPVELSEQNINWGSRGDSSPYNMGVTTGLLDAATKQQRNKLAQFDDLRTLLINLGLDHYIRTFLDNEIDMEIFRSLTDSDLESLGITAFGARRKLLLAIREMASRSNKYPPADNPRFSVAPGAERRTSSGW